MRYLRQVLRLKKEIKFEYLVIESVFAGGRYLRFHLIEDNEYDLIEPIGVVRFTYDIEGYVEQVQEAIDKVSGEVLAGLVRYHGV